MTMNIGRMDRLVEIQYPKLTRDTIGGDSTEWKRFARVWAQAIPLMAKERYRSAEIRESKTYTFRIRFLRNLGSEMRIIHDEQPYRITGIAELGRKEGLEITAEYLQDAGFN